MSSSSNAGIHALVSKISQIFRAYDKVVINNFRNPSIQIVDDGVIIHIAAPFDGNYDLTVTVTQSINTSIIQASFLITIGVDIVVTAVNNEYLDTAYAIAQYDEEIGMLYDDSADDDASIILSSQQDLFDNLLSLNLIN